MRQNRGRRAQHSVSFDADDLRFLDVEAARRGRGTSRSDVIAELIRERRGLAEGPDLAALMIEQIRGLTERFGEMSQRLSEVEIHVRSSRAMLGFDKGVEYHPERRPRTFTAYRSEIARAAARLVPSPTVLMEEADDR